MLKFEEIISKFQIEGEITDVKPLGHGTVNHTYEIVCGGEHYVLQEMNHIVFKYPTEVMNNLFLVTEYLHEVIEQEGRDPQLEGLTFIRTKAGNQLLQTENGSYCVSCWMQSVRIFASVLQTVRSRFSLCWIVPKS